MPEWIAVLILGIIEGVTEFLPISSTGHMLLAEHWLPHRQPEVFIAVIQSGAVLAVLLVFTRRLRQWLTQWREKETQEFMLKLAAAFLITAVGGVILKKTGFRLEKNPAPIAWATLIGGVLILAVERWLRGRSLRDQIGWNVAVAVGAGQLLAVVFPGLSRSGATILMALAMGSSRPAATEFSFLLGIPTLLSAGTLGICAALHHAPGGELVQWKMVLLGTAVAAVTAFASVKWLLLYVQSHTFSGFGWYRIGLGILILLLVR